MLISVVFSFRDEGKTIPELLRRLYATFEPLKVDYEFIFVNDVSGDDSLKILAERAKLDPRIKVINMARHCGSSLGFLAGMKYAKGDAVVYMDADLQDPPEVIPELIKKWKEGADVVYTTRISRAGESAIKMWITKMAYRVLRAISDGIDLPLNSGDFKLLDRQVVNELVKLDEKDPFLKGLVTWMGFKQVSVSYHRAKRFAGKTHYPLLGLGPLKAFISGVTSFSTVPLIVSLIIGFFVSFAAFLYLGYMLVMKFLGQTLPGWTGIMVVMLFLGGIQLFTLGIMGLYIGRIHNETKNRPNFIIESKINL